MRPSTAATPNRCCAWFRSGALRRRGIRKGIVRVTARAPASLVAALRRQSDGTQEQTHGQPLAVLNFIACVPAFRRHKVPVRRSRAITTTTSPARPGRPGPRARTAVLVPRGTGLPSRPPRRGSPFVAAAPQINSNAKARLASGARHQPALHRTCQRVFVRRRQGFASPLRALDGASAAAARPKDGS